MGKLRKAEVGILVVESSRRLEGAARELVPEERGPDGKPLTLGARMYRLRDQLEDDTWAAFQRWLTERNAYVHAEIDAVEDRERFHDDFETVLEELEALAAVEDDAEGAPVGVILFAIAVVCALLLAC